MAAFQRCSHDRNVPCTIKSEIEPAIGDFHEMILDPSAFCELGWIDEVCGTELFGPRFFSGVRVDSNDTQSTNITSRIDNS